jgi:hypothetical protein
MQQGGGSGGSTRGGAREPSAPAQRRSAFRPARPRPGDLAPTRIGEVLLGAQAELARRGGAYLSQEAWRDLVGPRIAARTRVGKLYRGTLVIKVASSAWCNELGFLERDIIARLVAAGHEVESLRLRVDDLGAAPRRARGPAAGGAATARDNVPLSPSELPLDLRDRLAAIEDPLLRAAIAEAACWSLGPRPAASRTGSSRTGSSGDDASGSELNVSQRRK